MNIGVFGPSYCDFQLCTIVDGLQSLGHDVWDMSNEGRNYMTPIRECKEQMDVLDFYIIAQTDDYGAVMTRAPKPKVILHGHDRWTDYVNVPNSPIKQPRYNEWNCNIAFVRDWDGQASTRFPIYPMEFAVERRFREASLSELGDLSPVALPRNQREYDIAFFGTMSTARRDRAMEMLRSQFKCHFGDAHTFANPDDKWSKWVNGRYVHDPAYYKALGNSVFALSPLGAGPSCGRTYEGYAAGCVPLIQKYPSEIVQIVPFVDGENCILWETPEELIGKVADYIRYRPDELDALQKRCREFSYKNLLSEHRAQFMLDKMKENGLI